MWVEYTIDQVGPNFSIRGDWPGEVMGSPRDPNGEHKKDNILYKPGDRFIVNEGGWLMRCNPEDETAREEVAA